MQVASYMRAVLRTLAQCHSHRLLHRDIKPGNFMLLNEDEHSPLKAIDFGLAVSFNPEELPRSDLGLEGTPWWVSTPSPPFIEEFISMKCRMQH
jgi:calcium-dependent protein kinase